MSSDFGASRPRVPFFFSLVVVSLHLYHCNVKRGREALFPSISSFPRNGVYIICEIKLLHFGKNIKASMIITAAMVGLLFIMLVPMVSALYSSKSDVIQSTDVTFREDVLKAPGIVLVEFYAPWCGHCKSLAPEFEKAATTLKGVAKLVAVDATVSEKLAQTYQVQGFPTLKIFGADKRNPVEYQGQRTADGLVTEVMKSVNQLVRDRKKGKADPRSGSGSSSSSSRGSGGSRPGGSGASGSSRGGGSEVVELSEANFKALVLDSTNEVWYVEFFAPWCGHCKNLAPEWETAAKQLKGSVRLGAVDATVHSSLAQKYGVKGYPTIKIFQAGTKKRAVDYNGPREAAGIVQHALQTLEQSGIPPAVHQIINTDVFNDTCGLSGSICVILFVPHIYDSSAAARNSYLEIIQAVAKSNRGKPITFAWSEGTVQPDLEKELEINFAYPTVAILSLERKVYAVQRVSWSAKNVRDFVNGVLAGSERKVALAAVPTIKKVPAWDGKDALPPAEEPLDADFLSSD